MWILPKQLHTSAYVPDTAVLISDLAEQSQICEPSLLARSKPSLARTWSQKWKRDSWTQHLSGRILKPSHGQIFVTAWTSSLEVIPASHSQQPGSDSDETTLATSGLGSQMELELCDLGSVSLRTSKDTLASDSEKSSANWKALVTLRRGEYSLRVKSAHLTNASECSSWPTATARDSKGPSARAYRGHPENLSDIAMMTWPTPTTAEAGKISCCPNYGQLGLSNHPEVHGYQVNRPKKQKSRKEASWPTCAARDYKGQSGSGRQERKGNPADTLPNAVAQHGLPAQVNPSTDGSRLESWGTPNSQPAQRKLINGKNQSTKTGQIYGTSIAQAAQQWGTPTARDHKSGRGNEEREYKELTPMVERTQNGKLNPRWVETLMGLPIGWTMPSCIAPLTIEPTNCDCLETESCQPPQLELF